MCVATALRGCGTSQYYRCESLLSLVASIPIRSPLARHLACSSHGRSSALAGPQPSLAP